METTILLTSGNFEERCLLKKRLQNGEELTEFECEDSSSEVEEVQNLKVGGRFIN